MMFLICKYNGLSLRANSRPCFPTFPHPRGGLLYPPVDFRLRRHRGVARHGMRQHPRCGRKPDGLLRDEALVDDPAGEALQLAVDDPAGESVSRPYSIFPSTTSIFSPVPRLRWRRTNLSFTLLASFG